MLFGGLGMPEVGVLMVRSLVAGLSALNDQRCQRRAAPRQSLQPAAAASIAMATTQPTSSTMTRQAVSGADADLRAVPRERYLGRVLVNVRKESLSTPSDTR